MYAPTQKKSRNRFDKELTAQSHQNDVNQTDYNLKLIEGDWNCVVNVHHDVHGTKVNLRKSYCKL